MRVRGIHVAHTPRLTLSYYVNDAYRDLHKRAY